MVRRVCRELGTKRNIIVISDEAHHCYRHKPEAEEENLTGDDRKEAEKREEEVRIWISGIEAVKAKICAKAIYDLSATPFFLRGSGYPEGTLFPWVISDFSLIDAIEAGIVKVPRVPVADDSVVGDQPTYRDLWLRIREDLPKKGRKSEELGEEPKLPAELEVAIQSPYGNYRKYYKLWEKNADAQAKGLTPPVFTGADEPYDKLKRVLRAEIDEAAWSSLYSTTSRPFPKPASKKIAVKVINHYGDEVLKVISV